ncbi:MAG: hypothetical protein IKF38_04995 [Clostridia bacterium]|nr:hypothetical protein [Clostridia bacterium]
MFRKTKELQGLVDSRTSALKFAEDRVKDLNETNKDLRNEVEEGKIENYNQHQKLLAIEKLLSQQDYGSIDNLKNKIRTILKKELVTDWKSQN